MAKTIDAQVPAIFNDIIRRRVANYIEGELNVMIKQKLDAIISDVLANIQSDVEIYRDMLRYETQLVVRAVYNGEDIQQKSNKEPPQGASIA